MKKTILLIILAVICMGAFGCKGAMPEGEMQHFDFCYYGLDPALLHRYTLEVDDKIYLLYQDGYDDMIYEKKRIEVNQSVFKDIEEIIEEYKLYLWNGWDKKSMTTDADGFIIKVIYENGEIKAQAYADMPDNFYDFKDTLETYFQDIISEYKNKQSMNMIEYEIDYAIVVDVINTDTIIVDLLNGQISRVKLIGVDASDSVNMDVKYNNTEVDGIPSDFVNEVIQKRDMVYLQRDLSETDNDDRLLRYVWLDVPVDMYDIDEVKTKMLNAILIANVVGEVSKNNADIAYYEMFMAISND